MEGMDFLYFSLFSSFFFFLPYFSTSLLLAHTPPTTIHNASRTPQHSTFLLHTNHNNPSLLHAEHNNLTILLSSSTPTLQHRHPSKLQPNRTAIYTITHACAHVPAHLVHARIRHALDVAFGAKTT